MFQKSMAPLSWRFEPLNLEVLQRARHFFLLIVLPLYMCGISILLNSIYAICVNFNNNIVSIIFEANSQKSEIITLFWSVLYVFIHDEK